MTECEAQRRNTRNRQNYLQHAIAHQLQLAAERETDSDDTRLRLLDECFGSLTAEAQALIQQRYGERQAVGKIAAALGRTATAISVRLFALRQQLRDCIERKWRALRASQS